MILLDRSHVKELLRFVSGIKSDIQYWAMVDVVLTGKTPHNVLLLGRRLEDMIREREGAIYVYDKERMLCFVRHDQPAQECNDSFTQQVLAHLPPRSCEVASNSVTADKLQRVEIRLATTAEGQNQKAQQSTLYSLRAGRDEKVILLADDNKDICELLKEELAHIGVCHMVHDVSKVLEAYLEHVPDIVFLDINFQGGSGLDVIEQLIKYDKDAYVIMVTGAGTASNAVAARTKGARSFIAKPFDPERLEAELRKCPTIWRSSAFKTKA
ncbi:MAG: response regulator [Alphaproteobacteria bacterium]